MTASTERCMTDQRVADTSVALLADPLKCTSNERLGLFDMLRGPWRCIRYLSFLAAKSRHIVDLPVVSSWTTRRC